MNIYIHIIYGYNVILVNPSNIINPWGLYPLEVFKVIWFNMTSWDAYKGKYAYTNLDSDQELKAVYIYIYVLQLL